MLDRDTYMSLWYKHGVLREGERLKVYADSLGKPTVGIGHLVVPSDNLKLGDKITKEQSRKLFIADSAKAERAALKQIKEMKLDQIDGANEFMCALISVNFQLGTNWNKKFTNTYAAIVRGDYAQAVHNIKKSLWHKQTPVRTNDFIAAIDALPEKEDNHHKKERPLHQTRTVKGSSIAATSLIASEVISETKDQIEPLIAYADYLQAAFVILALLGIGLTLYARVDDRKKGFR